MRFASKVDRYFHVLMRVLVIALLVLGVNYLAVRTFRSGVMFLLVALPFLLVVLPVYCRTYYEFEKGFLHVRCGLFLNRRIPYSAIRKAVPCQGMLATSGLSGSRVDLLCQEEGRSYELQLSPENQKEFLRLLLTRNPFVDTQEGWDWPTQEDTAWQEYMSL
mgnify:CR=1 FL=1